MKNLSITLLITGFLMLPSAIGLLVGNYYGSQFNLITTIPLMLLEGGILYFFTRPKKSQGQKMNESEKLNQECEKYIQEDINWGAYKNEVIKTANKSEEAKDDVKQFAMDAFFYGWQAAKRYLENEKA